MTASSISFCFQISVLLDGSKKVVEYMTKSAQGNILHYTFKSREIYPLFDRQWHKLGISVQSGIISLYLDCNLIERKQTDEKFTIDLQGRTLIASRAADDKPVDVSSMKAKLENLKSCFIHTSTDNHHKEFGREKLVQNRLLILSGNS